MSKTYSKTSSIIFIIIAFYTVQCHSQKTNSEKHLRTLLKSNIDTTIYYHTHITGSKIDPNLFFVGLEWGAGRQKLSIIKMNDQEQISWKYNFDYSTQSKNTIPGYIHNIKQISLQGFSNTFIEIIAGERGIYYYFLYEFKGEELINKLNYIPCILYNNSYLNLWQQRETASKSKKELSHSSCFGDVLNHGHLSLHKILYSDLNNDGYDDIKFTGIQLYKKEHSKAQRVFIYDNSTKIFNEVLTRRKSMINEYLQPF